MSGEKNDEKIIDAEFVETKKPPARALTETEEVAIALVNFPQTFVAELGARAMKALPRLEKIIPREKLDPSKAVDTIVDTINRVNNRGAPPSREPPPKPAPAPSAQKTEKEAYRPYRPRGEPPK